MAKNDAAHRRSRTGGGIAPAQQQVEGRDERHRSCHAVEDEKQYKLWRYLFEQIHSIAIFSGSLI